MTSLVSVLFTKPETVVEDYKRLMELASWQQHLTGERDLDDRARSSRALPVGASSNITLSH